MGAVALEPIYAVSGGLVRAGVGAAAWLLTTESAWIDKNFISVVALIPQKVKALDFN